MLGIVKKLLEHRALRRCLSVALLVALDAGALLAGLSAAAYLLGGPERVGGVVFLWPLLAAAWVLLFSALGLYDRAPVRRNPGALVGGVLSWAGLATAGAALYPSSGLRLGQVLLAASLALLLAAASRFAFEKGVERVYRRGLGRMPVLLMGEEGNRARVRATFEGSGAYRLAGEAGLRGEGGRDLASLREALDETRAVAVVLVGAERLPDGELLELLRSARLRGVRMRVVPGALALMRGRPILASGAGLPLLEVRYPGLDNTQRALKRAMDVSVSAAGLLLLAPLFLLLAVAVRLDSPGPAFFRQKRAGADGKTFVCVMFRSMRRDAEALQAGLEEKNEAEGPVFKIRHDPRVTRVGRFLRRWSLDELPQLWNVLKGEMSLVGPRPLPVRDFLLMEEEHKARLAAVPGMTGYWQISGRSDLSFEEMVRLDLFYIENWSLSFDTKIILKTLGAVVRREGAY